MTLGAVMVPDHTARNEEIKRRRESGETLESIAGDFGLTRERVRQILNKLGGSNSTEARALRMKAKSELLKESVEAFLDENGEIIHQMADAGVSRPDVEARFEILRPDIPPGVLREAIDVSGALFEVDIQDYAFPESVIESAVWYTVGRAEELSCDFAVAIREMDLDETREFSIALREEDFTSADVATVIGLAATARAYAAEHPNVTLTKKSYDLWRQQLLSEFGSVSHKGARPWPPTSQTVMKRLGNGYWNDAMQAVGLAAGTHGRSRGLLRFETVDYDSAVVDYLAQAAATGHRPTFRGYSQWVESEDRAGRRRPSAPSIRLRYRTWTTAKRAVATSGQLPTALIHRPVASSPGKSALHHAQEEAERFFRDVDGLPGTSASAACVGFVKRYVEEFEIRRRDWLRTVIQDDPTALARRLSRPEGLTREQRRLLELPEPDIHSALTDRYLDSLLKNCDPRAADGWISTEGQAELDGLTDETVLRFATLRLLRNFFTHDSTEARERLSVKLAELANLDPRFSIKQNLTRRVLVDWLQAQHFRRLQLLCASIPTIWQTMFVVETALDQESL